MTEVPSATTAEATTIRPAQAVDFPAIARLLVQLYRVELPGRGTARIPSKIPAGVQYWQGPFVL